MQQEQILGGRYRLTGQLGVGGMSVVWKAHDELLNRHVAVKVLDGPHTASRAARRRVQAEAQAAAQLSHPNVTNVYDYGEATDSSGECVPYVVMELLPGRTLSQRLAAGPLPPRVALRICAEVAGALSAAHDRHVVHRDVKPANVMLTPSGAKVLDFGLAAVAGQPDIDEEGQLLGTAAYLAPERLTGDEVLPASDVYALGLLIHRALTDELPWAADTPSQMLNAHVYVEPEPLPVISGVSGAVHDICDRCLAKDPADRPSAAEVAAVLNDAAGIVPPPSDDLPALRLPSPAAEGAASPTAEGTALPDDRGAALPAAEGTALPTAEGTALPGAGGTALPGAGGTAMPGAGGTAMPGEEGTALPGEEGTASQGGAGGAEGPAPASATAEPVMQPAGGVEPPGAPANSAAGRRWRAVVLAGAAVVTAVAVTFALTRPGERPGDRSAAAAAPASSAAAPAPGPSGRPVDATSAAAGAPTGPAAGSGTPAATGPAGAGQSGAPAGPPPASGPVPGPEASAPPPPAPGVEVRAKGGVLRVTCDGKKAHILGVELTTGYTVREYVAGPADEVKAVLASSANTSEIKVKCGKGVPAPNVHETPAKP